MGMLEQIKSIALKAGELLLEDYRKPNLKVITKPDDSPVTEADLRVSDFFLQQLEPLGVPVVTEEAVPEEVPDGDFFIVDPLDGTRYFIEGYDYFAVLIALVQKGRPTMGVIHFPALQKTFWAEKGKGAFYNGDKLFNKNKQSDLVAFSTGFHKKPQAKALMQSMNITQVKKQDSILKLGYLARGDVDLYPRFGPTYEWDTAPGQILVEEAGCRFWDVQTLKPLTYGKPRFKNSGFVVFREDLESKVMEQFKELNWRPRDGWYDDY